jgi:hypothetical protein
VTTSSTNPPPGDDRYLLPYVERSLADVLDALDAARSAAGTALVWTRIAIVRGDDTTD